MDEYLNAAEEWEKLRHAIKEYFTRYDIFLCPTVPMPAFPHGQNEFHIEGRDLAGRHTLRITLPWGPDWFSGHIRALRFQFRWTAHRRPGGGPSFRRVEAAAGSQEAGSQQAPDQAPTRGAER